MAGTTPLAPAFVHTADLHLFWCSGVLVLRSACRNAPNVHSSAKLPNLDGWHGAALSLTIEGNWSSYRAKLLKYMRQIAVITPYAQVRCACSTCMHLVLCAVLQFSFAYVAEDPKSSLKLTLKLQKYCVACA
jgi:hypothetical protein